MFYLMCIRPSLSKDKNHILLNTHMWYNLAFFINTQKFKKISLYVFLELIISLLNS